MPELLTEIDEHALAADALAKAVLKRAEAGGFAISTEIRRAALSLMRQLVKANPEPNQLLADFLRGFGGILRRYEPILARSFAEAELAAWLKGGQSVAEHLPPLEIKPDQLQGYFERTEAAEGPPKPPEWAIPVWGEGEPEPIISYPIIEAAAADLASRDLLMPPAFHAQMAQGQFEGFEVARTASLDAYEKIRNELVTAVVDGESLSVFRAKTAEAFDVSRLSPSHVEGVFRSNILRAYAHGARVVVEHPSVASLMVFAEMSPIRDSRLTELCRLVSESGLENLDGNRTAFFFVQDPVFRRFCAPRHWNCRCGTIYSTIERAARKGIRVANEWLKTGIQPVEHNLLVPYPNAELPAGWISPWSA